MSLWGNMINSITGTSTSAKQQFQNQMALQKDAQNFSKWQMANAHQMEVQDLKNAGINPVLTAGGSGASAGVSEGGASGGSPMIDPMGTILTAVNTAKDLAKTNADINNETNLTNAQVTKALKEAGYTQKQIDYYNKWGVFPGATTTSTHSANAFGLGGSGSTTKPIGLKEPTSAKSKSFWTKAKEGWIKQK